MIQSENKIESTQKKVLDCYHCGDTCETDSVQLDNHYFCCQGCKLVYSILSENGLNKYYELNPAAGSSRKSAGDSRFDFLDDPQTAARLISFQDDHRTQISFYIPAIHCSSCLWLLENLPKLNEGIESCRVDFLRKEARISFFNEKMSLSQLVTLLDMIGYGPHIIFKDLEEQKKPVADKSLYYKLGLAGFAFGNIMLFSFPEYLGLSHGDDGLAKVFSYLNIALIIPVLIYSGSDYFRSAWQGLRQKHLNIDVPVSLGILALFSRSLYEIFSHTGPGYIDSLAGLIFFLLIGKWFQQKTFARISFDRDFKSYFPIASTVIKNNNEVKLTLDQLRPGDQIRIRHGELIPADAIITEGNAEIDYSFVTGESVPVSKEKGDLVYAGGRQMGSILDLKVLKTVSNSYLTQLWNDKTFNKEIEEGNTSIIADRVARFFTSFILIVAFASLLYWLPKNTAIAINAFTAVLIVACPCAVALSIPFSFGNVIRILSTKGIYLRNSGVIEHISRINHLVFDKTGTITNVRSSKIEYTGTPLDELQKTLILSQAQHSTHPISRMIEERYKHLEALPVSDYMEQKGKGISGFANGKLVRIGAKLFFEGTGEFNNIKEDEVIIAIDDTILGYFRQRNSYRRGLKKLISSLSEKFRLSVVTGDNENERENLEKLFGLGSRLLFRQKPADKLTVVRALQHKGDHVAMIGDGLNDAGALQEAEVGIVVSEDTANFTPACDVIMDARQFESLESLLAYSRDTIRVVLMAYGIALIYNIIGLGFAVQGLLSPVIAAILMPLSSVSIVLFGMLMTAWFGKKRGFL